MRPENAKVKAVKDFQAPKTKKQVGAFLGLTGYHRRFIPNYADTASPLTDLTRKDTLNKVVWTPHCQYSFVHLKRTLSSSPILRSPDFNRQLILQTDASDTGVDAVFSQRDDDGTDCPVAYFSKKLLPHESSYTTVQGCSQHFEEGGSNYITRVVP